MNINSTQNMPSSEAMTNSRTRMLTFRIARRIKNGDNVPMRDQRFLAYHDRGMYNMAMSLRRHNEDPEDYDSLLRRDEDPDDSTRDGAINISEVIPQTNMNIGEMNLYI